MQLSIEFHAVCTLQYLLTYAYIQILINTITYNSSDDIQPSTVLSNQSPCKQMKFINANFAS